MQHCASIPIATLLLIVAACKDRDRDVRACAITNHVARCLMLQYGWDRPAALAAEYRVHHPHGPPMHPGTCQQCH